MAKPLPRGRPPWELQVVSGVAGRRFAVLVKIHHALADGIGALAVLGTLLDNPPHTEPADASLEAKTLPDGVFAPATEIARRCAQAAQIAVSVATELRPYGLVSALISLSGPSNPRRIAPSAAERRRLAHGRQTPGRHPQRGRADGAERRPAALVLDPR
jgi:diacylglycerol O-acyltransferase